LPAGKQLKVRRTIKEVKHKYRLLDAADYAAYRDVAKRLINDYPPEQQNVYLGVGRTATPILALLERLDPGRVAYLPIDDAAVLGANQLSQVRLAHQAHVTQLIRSFIPPAALKPGSTLVLFHKGDGMGLRRVKELVEAHLRARGQQVTVKAVALHDRPTTPAGVEQIDIQGRPPLLQLDSPEIKAVAPISRHRVANDPVPANTRRSKYDKLLRALEPFIQRDTDLNRFLQ
jgi:hypothetical protein